jgi:hypothetical protein
LKAIPASQQFCNVVPTQGCPQSFVPQAASPSNMSNLEIQCLIEQQINMIKKLQVNSNEDLDQISEDKVDGKLDAIDDKFHLDDTGFFVNNNNMFMVGSEKLIGTRLVLDTGASKSTVSNTDLLTNLKPVTKNMKTYSGAIEITHMGLMKFGLYNIYPFYYAPAGKCNLISVSQLEDHGFWVSTRISCFWFIWNCRL